VDAGRELALLIRAGWRLCALETLEEERALRLLERAAQGLERELVTWSVASGLHPGGQGAGSLDDGLRALSSRAAPSIFALLDAHRLLHDPIAARRVRDLLPLLGERKQVLVLVGPRSELPLEISRELGRVELPLPRTAELEALFARGLEAAEPETVAAAARAALGLTAAEAARIARKAAARAGGLGADAIAEIVREKQRALGRSRALAFHEGDEALDQVGGLGELKRWLRDRRAAFNEGARRFGLPEPRGLLLLGVQGCGKSLCAKAVAREWQFPLLRLDLAAAFGADRSPEAAIQEAAQVAESLAPAVLWIDEMEKGFAAASADPRASRVFGSFLIWLSEKRAPVFVVATANDIAGLPPELLRRGRFDEIFFVDLPSARERAEILAIHLRRRGRDPARFPLEELAEASERLSGAELEQVVRAGLYAAFAERRELHENDLKNAIGETVPLYDVYEQRIKELRDWARTRARPASVDARMIDLFLRQQQQASEPPADPIPSDPVPSAPAPAPRRSAQRSR
jgi:SpoVK/Ycf46/Vps4 family AAA+-type ATPase